MMLASTDDKDKPQAARVAGAPSAESAKVPAIIDFRTKSISHHLGVQDLYKHLLRPCEEFIPELSSPRKP